MLISPQRLAVKTPALPGTSIWVAMQKSHRQDLNMTNQPSSFDTIHNRGWNVVLAGTGINLALGVLYVWSLFKGAIGKEFGWQSAQLNDPYALCCLVFAFSMILAGRCQDKLGPRLTASLGGVLVGIGLVLISTTQSYAVWVIGFGVLVGLGLGFGYSSATPPALKWFPPSKTGMVAGLVVAGFGLAPVYLAPLSEYLLRHCGLLNSMRIYGIAFAVIVCGLAQLLLNPPSGYVVAKTISGSAPKSKRTKKARQESRSSSSARDWSGGVVSSARFFSTVATARRRLICAFSASVSVG